MRPLVKMIARIVQKNPSIADNPEYLMATLSANIPDFDDITKCVNCGASMSEYLYTFTILDALLIFAMARQVARNLEKNPNFTEANKIHLPSLKDINHTSKIRQGYTGKLGLIAKYKGKDGHQVRGMWVITKRGWSALRGEPVPKSVRVFRGQILDRPDDTVTLSEVFRGYTNKIEDIIGRGKMPKTDNREEVSTYDPNHWVHIAGIHQGSLI